MESVENLITRMREIWATPASAIHRGEECPFKLRCDFESGPAASSEISELADRLQIEVPPDILNFWSVCNSALLFEDVKYGQWGLNIMSPADSMAATNCYQKERPNDALAGDLIIGKFLGDSDLLLLRSNKNCEDYSSVMIVLPMDHRKDWAVPAKSLNAFIEMYELNHGDKYWECPH